jgi:hypothetical protein
MIYIKSVVVGVVTAIAAVLLYALALFAYFVLLPIVAEWSTATGSGGIGIVVSSGPVLGVALVGFVVGFYWKLRSAMRAKRRL